MTTAATPPAAARRPGDVRRRRAAGIPLNACRLRPRSRRPHPPDRARLVVLSNNPDHDLRRPFWIVGTAADRAGETGREWHMSAEAAWAGPPPADERVSRIPHPAVRQVVGYDLRERPEANAVAPIAISWNNGRQTDEAGVVWYSDGSTLPLPTYCEVLHHAGARKTAEPPKPLAWTTAPGCAFLQAEQGGQRIAMCVRLKRAAARDAQAVAALRLIETWNRSRAAS